MALNNSEFTMQVHFSPWRHHHHHSRICIAPFTEAVQER